MTDRPEKMCFPAWLHDAQGANRPCEMRAFGSSMEDLAVEFRLAPRVELITELLALCLREAGNTPIERKFVVEMPVGLRMEALIRLAALADSRTFCWRLRCTSTECGQESEFELTADEIVSQGSELRDLPALETEIAGEPVLVRRPTGADQAQWIAQPPERESEFMLRAILVRPSLDDLLAKGQSLESIAVAIDEVMDRFDPLPGFHVSGICPHCGKSSEVSPDLSGVALERLFRGQQALIEDVHRLASHYHWTEDQILELPAWRRQSYLDLIGGTA
jgi:hypothetical protein